jgi:hypothetical protein
LLVRTNEDHAAAAGHSVDVEGWSAEFDAGLPSASFDHKCAYDPAHLMTDADPFEILRRDAGYGSPALLVVPIGADAVLAADDLVDRGEECGDARQVGTLGPGGCEIPRQAPLYDVEPLFVG